MYLVSLDISVNVALPDLTTNFGTDIQTVQWIIVSFVATRAGLAVSAGSFGDQFGLKREHVSGIRTQSKDPRECCAALRRFARGIGRGRQVREDPKSFDMNQLGALMAATLRAMGKGKEVAAILDSHEDQKTYEA